LTSAAELIEFVTLPAEILTPPAELAELLTSADELVKFLALAAELVTPPAKLAELVTLTATLLDFVTAAAELAGLARPVAELKNEMLAGVGVLLLPATVTGHTVVETITTDSTVSVFFMLAGQSLTVSGHLVMTSVNVEKMVEVVIWGTASLLLSFL